MVGEWTPSEAARRGAKRVWLDSLAARTVTAMRSRGLRPILLKGPPIARWLYADDPTQRGYEDVDLIVASDELEAAESVLVELGFERRTILLTDDPEPHAEAFIRESDGAAVDLHRTIHRCEHLPDDVVWGCVSADTETMNVGGADVEVPSIPVRVLHVTFHPDPSKNTAGDRPFVDLARAIARVDLVTWKRAAELAESLGTTDAMGFGLRLVPEGDALADQLGLPRAVPEGAILRDESTSTQFVARLAELDGWRAKARYVRQKLFPPRAYMERSTALARRGRLSLLLAYVQRVVRAPARVPGALAGLRRIRRRRAAER